jgi:predicted DNA-binding ribbon-helix-helix protein
MKSLIVKRSVVIDGHKTSVSLEDPFWTDLKTIAHARQMTLSALVARIDGTREHGNLSSAIRMFVLHHFLHGNTCLAAHRKTPMPFAAPGTPSRAL